MLTIEQINKEVHKLDPNLEKDSNTFKTSVVLLSGLVVGANIKHVAKFTGYPRQFVQERAQRLTANKIWQNGKTACDWFDKNTGATQFWLDVLVAEGLVQRAKEKAV